MTSENEVPVVAQEAGTAEQQEEILGDATWTPTDDKLRFTPFARNLSDGVRQRLRDFGFKWAPKQELYVAPNWTPEREDFLIELCGAIGDEDKTQVDRAEERAERFEGFAERRQAEGQQAYDTARRIIDSIPMGQPILVGHHSERRARRDALKIHNAMDRSVKAAETAEYWSRRAASSIAHALYKERPDVRARRIKKLETELRKLQKRIEKTQDLLKLWQSPKLTQAGALAALNYVDHASVTLPDGSSHWSAWSALHDGKIDLENVRQQRLTSLTAYLPTAERWVDHLQTRLTYERAMLAGDGGTAADRTKPEVGGACRCWASPRGGYSLIRKVNKVSVTVLDNWGNGGPDFTRNIPFDKLSDMMSKAQVDTLRAEGRFLREFERGFILKPAETPGVSGQ